MRLEEEEDRRARPPLLVRLVVLVRADQRCRVADCRVLLLLFELAGAEQGDSEEQVSKRGNGEARRARSRVMVRGGLASVTGEASKRKGL
jgi:hypothetical protein